MTPSSGNSFLQAYLEQNKKLVKTMVIKSSASAEVLNGYLKLKYGESSVDQYNPQTWKYYLNICGEYHPIDTQMTVTSLDTLEEIVFSKENLAIHTATAEAYQYGTRYYYSLINRYPDQEQLILGMLYPADMQQAVSSEEGSILSYPKELVEPQEQTLMVEFEDFIKRYLVRWNVQAFGLSDSLYNTAYHGVLYLSLLPKLLNLRLRRCHTEEVHSFHIREYLASNGGLEKYLPFMTLKQALFLYRNLRYLQGNVGKVHILEKLIEKILTDRRIPIAEYSVRQLNEFDSDYYPKITARRKPINSQYNIGEKNYIDLTDLYDKERKLTYGTGQYYDDRPKGVDRKFQNSVSSVVQTKNLESNMVDYNDAVPDPLEAVLLRQWADMALHGRYEVVINFKDPKTSEMRALYARDALIYMTYVSLKSIGVDVQTIPAYINLKFRRQPKPTVNDLLSVVDTSIEGIRDDALDIINNQPQITPCYSTSMFFNLSYKIYEEAKRHWLIMSNAHDMNRRAAINAMVLKLYADEKTAMDVPNRPYSEWLSTNNLPVYDMTLAQADELIRNIFTEATGLLIDETKQLKNIQKAMLSLLGDLSSYSIQLIREINDSQIRPLNWAAIRGGNLKYSGEADIYVEVNNRVNNVKSSTEDNGSLDAKYTGVRSVTEHLMGQEQNFHFHMSAISNFVDERNFQVPFGSFTTSATYPGYDPAISAGAGYIGKENFLALTDEEKNQLVDIYA